MADGYPAGTASGQNVITPTGNSFIDGVASLSNVLANTAGSLLGAGGTFIDRLTALKIANAQANQPSSTQTTQNANLTDQSQLAQWLKYGVFAAIILGSAFAVAKLVK